MRYYVIAGEASGDLHGSNLIKEIKIIDNQAVVRCWGGELMQQAGGHLVKHYRDLAFMGFAEVIKNLPVILRNMSFCKKDVREFSPDVLVLIDYPGFNLRIAKWARKNGIKTLYYISPQVWAWKQSRVRTIKKVVDKMIVILPFEKEFYKRWNYKVEYVGHPLVEVVDQTARTAKNDLQLVDANGNAAETQPGEKIVALLPGSRKQEVQIKLPLMLQTANYFPDYSFIIAQAPSMSLHVYAEMIQQYPNVKVAVTGHTYSLLKQSSAALVTSGTATLETALFGVPQVVCYKGSFLSYQIAKRLVKVKFISLVNLILDREVVKELIQDELTVENVKKELNKILNDDNVKARILNDYEELKRLLKQDENASAKAAKELYVLAIS